MFIDMRGKVLRVTGRTVNDKRGAPTSVCLSDCLEWCLFVTSLLLEQ